MTDRKWWKVLDRYATALSASVVLCIAVLMITTDPNFGSAELLSSIGVNLLAAVVFAVIFSLVAGRIQQRSVEHAVRDEMSGIALSFRLEVAKMHKDYLPTGSYPPLDPTKSDFGDHFNSDITESLESTKTYAFRGPSAHYVAARLTIAKNHPQTIRVAMQSPANKRGIARHASDRATWRRSAGKTIEGLIEELQHELAITVVSLFDYRHFCPVELAYVDDTAVYRYELMDDSVYISWYHSPGSLEAEMPRSLRFPSGSFIYETMKLDLNRRFQDNATKVTFGASDGDDVLITHLSGILNVDPTSIDLRSLRADYEKSAGNFKTYLRSLYRRTGRSR